MDGVLAAAFLVALGAALPLSAGTLGSPFRDAVAVWRMGGPDETAGESGTLVPAGAVRLGTELRGDELRASLKHGGSEGAAEFGGGYLQSGMGLRPETTAFTLFARVQIPRDASAAALVSQPGLYRLLTEATGSGPELAFELRCQGLKEPARLTVPLTLVGPGEWHGIVCRYDGAKVQLFIDGVWLDEGFTVGALPPSEAKTLLGAESVDGAIRSGFRGRMGQIALWDRALSDSEVESLSGGRREVARYRKRYVGDLGSMQYWRPGRHFYVGDCLPFYHEGVFHFAYLLDRGHHTSKGGLGAHQWVQTTSTDLVHWKDQPMMIPVTDQREGSICTGSVYPHEGTYYAFYATRLADWSEHLSLAISPDGIHYTKTQPTLILSPRPELRKDFRDPHVFRDPGTGLFHLLIAAVRQADGKGLLAHYTSSDLKQWKEETPFVAGLPLVPECPDYFEWRGWYYLVFSQGGVAHYRISRSPLGPWTAPEVDVFDGDQIRVLKTAGFTGNRRLGVAFLPVAPDRYAGHAVFRELIQHEDGSLGSHFPEEMLPKVGKRVALSPTTLTNARAEKGGLLRIGGADSSGSVLLDGLPHNARLRLTLEPAAGIRGYGLRLGASATGQGGVEVRFSPSDRQVQVVGGPSLAAVEGLDRKLTLDIILKDDILDLCVDGRRTLIGRIPTARGEQIMLFSEGGALTASGIDLRLLK